MLQNRILESDVAKTRVLVVEDEKDIRDLFEYNLVKHGYQVTAVTSGEEALQRLDSATFDLVLLDIMLPGLDGLDVCRKLKYDPQSSSMPVVILTAKNEDTDIVAGLELGADDYIVKPFSPNVLIARIRAVLRRKQEQIGDDSASLTVHELTIDPQRFSVTFRGRSIVLSSTEFRLLHILARKPGWVFSRDQIVNALHGDDYPVTDRSIDVQIVGLRRKLGEAGKFIQTIRGVGYRFKE
jgi:two-component system phosphate regulon response regulator PhoB